MRLFLLASALVALVAAAPARKPAARDWTQTVTPTPSGFWIVGNPAARVKLAEWASYTCPHCAHFAVEAAPVLEDRMIRDGSLGFEVRHLIRDPLDLAAVVVARCGSPRGFLARHTAIFAGQQGWTEKGAAYLQANGADLGKLAPAVAFRRIADNSGLSAIARAGGTTEPQLAACFKDQAALDRVTGLNKSVPAEVTGTPTFILNGAVVPNATWADLEPKLRAAGAK